MVTLGLTGRIVSQQTLNSNYRLMVVNAPAIAGAAQPGQFLHIRCGGGTAPLLRRPISIHRAQPAEGTVSLLYEVKGLGTAWLAGRKPGAPLDVIGPLGNGFRLEGDDQQLVLVAGGVGIAPLFFLAERACQEGRQVRVLLGGRRQEMILAEGALRQLGVAVEVATDDGSYGHHGQVTDLLAAELEQSRTGRSDRAEQPDRRRRVDRVCACGPRPMLAVVSRLSSEAKVSCSVSLEAYMACGVGACRGCVVAVRDAAGQTRYQNACTHGPVFDAKEVVWSGA